MVSDAVSDFIPGIRWEFGWKKWCSRPELNGDKQFRKLRLYPFELREHKFWTAYALPIFCQDASYQCEMDVAFITG